MKAFGVGMISFGAWMGGCTFVQAGNHYMAAHVIWGAVLVVGCVLVGVGE